MKNYKVWTILGLLTIIFFGSITPALADSTGPLNNVCQKIMDDFYNATIQWNPLINQTATWIFWSLALLNLAWAGIQLALKNGDLGDFVREVIKFILFIGFWSWILQASPGLLDRIIQSFIMISSSVPGGSQGVLPSDVLENSWNVYVKCMSSIPWYQVGTSITMAMLSIFMLAVSVYISAMMLVINIESYFAVIVGQIFLGFAGSMWTKDFALSYVKYIVSLGFRMLVINLAGALTVNMYKSWALTEEIGVNEISVLLVGAMLLFFIMKMLPEMAASIMAGGQFAPNPVNVVAGAGTIAAGLAMGGGSILAKAGMGTAQGVAIGAAAKSMGGSTMGNVASAAGRTFMDNLGKNAYQKQSMMGGTYSNLTKMRQAARLEEIKPKEGASFSEE